MGAPIMVFLLQLLWPMSAHSQSINEISVTARYIQAVLKQAKAENTEHFCTIVHNNLTSQAINYLANSFDNVPMVQINLATQFEGVADTKSERQTSVCRIVIDRMVDETKLSLGARFMPRAKFIVLSKRTYELSWGRKYLTPPIMFVHEFQPGVVHVQANCNSKLANVWRQTTGYMYPVENVLNQCPDIREQIKGQDFISYGYGYVPYFKTNPDNTFDGVDVRILSVLAEKYGFNVVVRRSIGWDVKRNGNWTTGTVGRVYHGDAQIGIGSMAFTSPRYEGIDYTHYNYFGGMYFFMRKPGPLKSFLKPIEPIDQYGWIGFLSSGLALGGVLFLTLNFHPFFQESARNPYGALRSLTGPILMLIQACHFGGKPFYTRIRGTYAGALAIMSWLLVGTFFNFFYDATLRATLLAVQYEKPIQTIEGLFANKVTLHLLGGTTYVKSNLELADNPLFRETWELAVDGNLFYIPTASDPVPQSLLDDVAKKNYAVLALDGVFEAVANFYYQRTGQQPFYKIREKIIPFFSGFVLAKDHYMLNELISKSIERLTASGIITSFLAEYIPPKIKDSPNGGSGNQVMRLEHISSTFIIYWVLILFSAIAFLFELCSHTTKKKKPLKPRRTVTFTLSR